MGILRMILTFLRAFFISRANLAAENVMLRQQLIVVHRSNPRPKLRQQTGYCCAGCHACGPAGDRPCSSSSLTP